MKVILFDFDGVIVDTFSFCYRIIANRDGITEQEYRSRFEGNINVTSKSPTRSPDPNAKPFDFFGQYTPELMGCMPNRELLEVLKSLADQYTLIIVSSTSTPAIKTYLESQHLEALFTEILGNDVEKSKTKKIQGVLDRYQLQSNETMFITDTLGDIKEAKECGVQSIAVTWGYHPVETLKRGEPYRIVSQPQEILEAINSYQG